MNFSSDSVKHESKSQNEDFYFELKTPRGHFFAVLDFATHDLANLNATLKGKLETIVGSFVSLSRFSADLFLGFLTKEINNFLYNLRAQSGGPDLLCSAALALVSGNRLTYYLCGDVGINIHNGGRILPLQGVESQSGAKFDRLGGHNQESPLSDHVQTFTLQDNDVVLMMTQGLEGAFDTQELNSRICSLNSSDARVIRDSLMEGSATVEEDRTLVVITGPYERYVDPVLADLSKAVVSLEERLNELSPGKQQTPLPEARADQDLSKNLAAKVETLTDGLKGKANHIDFLELDQRVKSIDTLLNSKADKADVLSLQSDVLKLGIAVEAAESRVKDATASIVERPTSSTENVPSSAWRRSFAIKTVVLVLVLGIGSGLLGAWLLTRNVRRQAEIWSVKTFGNQITITRLDGGGNQGAITLNVNHPLQPTEQNFSSFADVKRYIDALTASGQTSQTTPSKDSSASDAQVLEITVKPGDSLRRIAQQNQVSEQQIKELNPTITRWSTLRSGQRIVVPARPSAKTTTSPAQNATAKSAVPGTIEITVGPGDSINRFAMRYNTTPERLRELNPNISNWGSIQIGQKVLVPTPPSG